MVKTSQVLVTICLQLTIIAMISNINDFEGVTEFEPMPKDSKDCADVIQILTKEFLSSSINVTLNLGTITLNSSDETSTGIQKMSDACS